MRISDWISDVCSSDLSSRRASIPSLPHPCAISLRGGCRTLQHGEHPIAPPYIAIMADRLTPEQRSAHMARIRRANTKPELVARQLLHGLGYRFRIQFGEVPGRPDIAFPARRRCRSEEHTSELQSLMRISYA